ncbi:uncharacterized protein QC763_508075 [Podospora pseudopauciseta]|uniref:Uncharacterized protein n=1 Tax=Podospora pseudopauciseta TaxID=2093780 RepID=A0ABR0H9V6_9PEZI|nr:hypothetical protein QC763_508075 [Podospora pseudopauciseta]
MADNIYIWKDIKKLIDQKNKYPEGHAADKYVLNCTARILTGILHTSHCVAWSILLRDARAKLAEANDIYWRASAREMKDRKPTGKIHVAYGLALQRDFFIELVEWLEFSTRSMDYDEELQRKLQDTEQMLKKTQKKLWEAEKMWKENEKWLDNTEKVAEKIEKRLGETKKKLGETEKTLEVTKERLAKLEKLEELEKAKTIEESAKKLKKAKKLDELPETLEEPPKKLDKAKKLDGFPKMPEELTDKLENLCIKQDLKVFDVDEDWVIVEAGSA